MEYTLYRLTNRRNGKAYIGKAKHLKSRISRHWTSVRAGSTNALHRAMRKYGKVNFSLEVLGTYDTEAEVFAAEIAGSREHGTRTPGGYNMTDGGEGPSGCIPSIETRRKRSLALAGRAPCAATQDAARAHNTGRKLSLETRAKLSSARRGVPKSDEHRANISKSKTGVRRGPMSADQKAKIGAAGRGRKKTAEAIEKTAAAHRGMKRSAKTRAKMSAFWAARRLAKKLGSEWQTTDLGSTEGRPIP